MKRKFTRIISGILAGVTLASILGAAIVEALVGLGTFTVIEGSGITYLNQPWIGDVNNLALVAGGWLQASGLDGRVLQNGVAVPALIADNKTLFVGNATPNTSTYFRYTGGNALLGSMPIITGTGGNVTTIDTPALELGSSFDISVSVLADWATSGDNQSLFYKRGAAKLNISAANTVKFHALNADDSDNWTLTGAVTPGVKHTVRVYSDGATAHLYVDGSDLATHSILASSTYNAGNFNGGSSAQNTDIFYRNGRWWHFYYNVASDYDMYFTSSADFATWDAATKFATGSYNPAIFEPDPTGNYVHCTFTTGGAVYYKRGGLNADGTVTWDADQLVTNANSPSSEAIGVDATSHVWIAVGLYGNPSDDMWKNANTDGTWATAFHGYATLSGAGTGGARYLTCLGGSLMYLWARNWNGGNMVGRYWNGAAWSGADESIRAADGLTGYYGRGSVADGSGNLFILFGTSTSTVSIRKRSSGGSWGTDTAIYTNGGTTYQYAGLSYDNVSGKLYVFYCHDSTGLYFKSYDMATGVVSTETTLSSAGNYIIPQGGTRLGREGGYVGVIGDGSGGNRIVGYVSFPWSWNDNSNQWAWMLNNSVIYADNITMAVSGVPKLKYMPTSIISGTTLVDSQGTQNGVITWGTNPTTVTFTLNTVSVDTLAATNIQASSATLNGLLLMSANHSATIYFEYGTTSGTYPFTSPQVVATQSTYFAASVTGLQYNTTYYFQAVAIDEDLTVLTGGELSFTTSAGGSTTFTIVSGSAAVFSNYMTNTTNVSAMDLLFVAEVMNTYPPFYPAKPASDYFWIQLIGTDNTTVLGAVPLHDWGVQPVAVYLNATQAAGITQRGAYFIRMTPTFVGANMTQYQLQPADWKGADLNKLDWWCRGVAKDMEIWRNGTTASVASFWTLLTDRDGPAINDYAGGYFNAGIPGITAIRPNLFTTSSQNPSSPRAGKGNSWDNSTAWATNVGTNIANDAAVWGLPLGLNGRDFLAGAFIVVIFLIVASGTSAMGGFGALGLFLISIPIAWLGVYFKIIPAMPLMVVVIIFGWFAIRQFVVKTT